ncbi:hypothetical protein J5N97_007026 [Dioscorea zingiberensis]|uniref:Uncharacterized protein n=1 Tax=Dioscorea zingiberensis TaxID=325984 RepID=A0A9D5DBI8_9LILI|nr:hypothetical protein J5N97_007026 [Dioscorea zingiberensis]
MGLKKGMGMGTTPSANEGKEKRNIQSSNHWAFLEEIEAPMWVDLTLEAQLMKQDIDDAWFRTSHLIHQMPSHCLKSSLEVQFNSPKMLYQSPKLPDSVSRSRGKHFKSRKWAMDELSLPMEIKLVGKPVCLTKGKWNVGCSSSSTITTDSPLRKPKSSIGNQKYRSSIKSGSIGETICMESVVSQDTSMKAKSGCGDPKSSSSLKSSGSEMSSTISHPKSTSNPRRSCVASHLRSEQTKGENFLQNRKSSCKSSVGSSYSLQCKINSITSTATFVNERNRETKRTAGLKSGQKVIESQLHDRNLNRKFKSKATTGSISTVFKSKVADRELNSKFQKKAANAKNICQESNSKAPNLAAPRKPLSSLNETRTAKSKILSRLTQKSRDQKFKSLDHNKKENSTEEEIQDPKSLNCRKIMIPGHSLTRLKGKGTSERQDKTATSVAPRNYFR